MTSEPDDKEIIVVDPPQQNLATTPATLLQMAVNQGADLERLEQLMDLQTKWEEREAQKAYFCAVADFKSDPVVVTNDKVNTQFGSGYSSLGNLLNTVTPILGEHGLSVMFDIDQSDKTIKVSCIMRHRLGHTEKVEMTASPDGSGGNSKNEIQKIKSTITYLRAATFSAITGLASTDADKDDDGNGSGVVYITETQSNELHSTITENINEDYIAIFLKYLKIESFDLLPANRYKKAKADLNAVIAKQNKDK